VWRITKDQYEEKLQVYKDKTLEAQSKVSEYIKADFSYKSQLVQVVDLCKNSKRLFESSIVEEQNSLLKFLLSDCVIKEKRLEYQVNSPFNFILDLERSIRLRTVGVIRTWIQDNYSSFYVLDMKEEGLVVG
jgi:hypothetical protein